MLTRLVRNQLIIFTIAGIIGVVVMVLGYMRVPTLLGIGHLTVKLEMPASGGLYRFSNVTYRGVEVGKVTEIKPVNGNHVESDSLAKQDAKNPIHSHRASPQYVSGGRTIRRSSAARRSWPFSARRVSNSLAEHRDSPAGGTHAESAQFSGEQHSGG
jgi:hypothetical protein